MQTGTDALWDEAASGFDQWTHSLWGPLAVPLLEAAALRPGERVFDACCGTGVAALLAAESVGTSGQVDAVDLSPEMVRLARESALTWRNAPIGGFRQLDFTVANVLTSLPSRQREAYDVVLCGFGIFLLGDLGAGLSSLLDRLRPGGRIVLSVWQGRPFDALSKRVLAACEAEGGGLDGASLAARNIGKLNSESKLLDFLTGSGLVNVSVAAVPHRVRLSRQTAWDFVRSSLLLAALPSEPAAVERVRQRLNDTWEPLDLVADALVSSAVKLSPILSDPGRE